MSFLDFFTARLAFELLILDTRVTYPVDTSNPENILAQRVQGTEYTYAPIRPWTARKYFAVTAIDRCGNESKAIQQQ